MIVRLEDVYTWPRPEACYRLFVLLGERTPEESISHRKMPSYGQHSDFFNSHPYLDWCFVTEHWGGDPLGAVYLTRIRELGVFIFKKHRGRGVGKAAVRAMIEKHGPGRYVANIANANGHSQMFFTKLGFRPVQVTYVLERSQ